MHGSSFETWQLFYLSLYLKNVKKAAFHDKRIIGPRIAFRAFRVFRKTAPRSPCSSAVRVSHRRCGGRSFDAFPELWNVLSFPFTLCQETTYLLVALLLQFCGKLRLSSLLRQAYSSIILIVVVVVIMMILFPSLFSRPNNFDLILIVNALPMPLYFSVNRDDLHLLALPFYWGQLEYTWVHYRNNRRKWLG